jgi:tetratricopeptide (TPR) repeat protein
VSRSAADAKKVEPPRWGTSNSRPAPMEKWVRVDGDRKGGSRGGDSTRAASARPSQSGAARVPRTKSLPTNVAAEIREGAGVATKRQRDYLVRRSEQSIAAYEAGRFQEALRLSKSVLNKVPTVVALIEVAGLASYRLGYWREAARFLSSYSELSGENDQIPALMDCYRALGRTPKVAELWTELRRGSANAEIIAEARIVGAGALADTGDVGGAISLLASGGTSKTLRNPAERHIRQWYALADLYERAGDVPRARELFLRVARADRDAYDVQARLESLGRRRRSASRSRTAPRKASPKR